MNEIEQTTRKYIAENYLNDLAKIGDEFGWAEHISHVYDELGAGYFPGDMPKRMDIIEQIAEVFAKVSTEQETEHK